jgi:hypothetical protein
MKFKNFVKRCFKPFDAEGNDLGETGETVGTGNDARLALLSRINDQNDALRAEEFESINDDGSTEQFVAQRADGTREELTDETTRDEAADAEIRRLADESGDHVVTQPAEKTWKIKTNGREMILTEAQMIERAQKVESADQYLAEAARLRQEQLRKNQVSESDPVTKQSVDEEDLALARAIQMGSEEEAVAALRTIRKAQSPSLTQDDIAKTIDERLTFNEAISEYRKNYSDVVSDPILNQLALDMDKKLIAEGDTRPYAERYQVIGDSIRKWADGMAKARAPAPPASGTEKLVRKAAATQTPKAASQKTVSSVEEEAEETPSSIIAGIAKSRGGPQWMQGPATRQ